MFLLPRLGSRRRSAPLLVLTACSAALLTACTFGGSSSDGVLPTPSPPGPAATPAGAQGTPGSTDDPGASPSASPVDPATDPQFAAFYGQKVTWTGCKDGSECAKVTVPVDWAAPSGATLKLALIRQKAKGKRLGSMLFNPGGPGVSTVNWLREGGFSSFGKAIRNSYDIVGWDTRGVGSSDPVTCLPNSALDRFFSEDATPDTPAEEATFTADTKAYVAACQANTGALLKHVDTISTAKDMDVLRAVLGDSVLTYMGASYGTYMGAWYAQEFPWRVGRLVLDGAIDPSLTSAQFAQGQAQGFARAVQGYVDDCLRKRDCPLKGTREDAYSQLAALSAKIDARPLRTDSGRPLTQALFNTGLLQGMYSQQLWPLVTTALTEAFKGNGTTMLLVLADLYNERDDNGTYGQALQATATVYCLDHPETRTVDQIAADSAALKAAYPPFGDVIGWGSVACSLWPYPGVTPTQKLTAEGARPILVVGTTQDPATPYEWAQALASQLSSGHLLTRKGQGHTGYNQGSTCTDRAVEAYLVGGVVPKDGTVCS